MACESRYHVGDNTIVEPYFREKNSSGVWVAVNISSATTQTVTFLKGDGLTVETVTTSFTTDGTDGLARTAGLSAVLTVAGSWHAQARVILSDGNWRSCTWSFHVYPILGA